MIQKIISGGQTGVDRAALDVALELNIPHGGWCPKGRRAEDGVVPSLYQLKETDSSDYQTRTRLNVEDADATLILYKDALEGGTKYTYDYANGVNKPVFLFDLTKRIYTMAFIDTLSKTKISILNIAGPRESKDPGIYQHAKKSLKHIFDQLLSE